MSTIVMSSKAVAECPLEPAGPAAPGPRLPRARLRLKLPNLPPLPLDIVDFNVTYLNPTQKGAMLNLLSHLWAHGELPSERRALAAVAQIHARTFERMESAISLHFDIDEGGRWRHYDLEELRVSELAKRAARATAGKSGAARRWGKSETDDDGSDHRGVPPTMADEDAHGTATPTADAMAKPMANGMADAIAKGDADPAQTGPVAMPSAMAPASGADGSIDRSSVDLPETNDRSFTREAPAGHGSGMANANAFAITNGAARADAVDAEADPAPAPEGPCTCAVDDAAILAALRTAGGTRIPARMLNAKDLGPVRALIADGCDLARDIVPAIADFTAGLKGPLRTFAAAPIRAKAEASRDRTRAEAQTAGDRLSRGPFVEEGKPAWRAWLLSKGASQHPSFRSDKGKVGWRFPTEWPPGWDETKLAELERTAGHEASVEPALAAADGGP